MYLRVPNINPYAHQKRALMAIKDGKNVLAVIHRRAGKDIFCIQAWLIRALERVGTHVYLFPLYSQARSVIWQGMDFDGKPFLAGIPSHLIAKKNEARMEIELYNGSRMILAGSNSFDSLMGSNPVTIIYSEFALHHPLARQYLNPIIVQNQGLEIIQSTPRGMNHLFDVYEQVRDNPRYHVEHLTVEETYKHDGSAIVTKEDIKRAKEMGMSEEMIRQEFYADFEVGNMGAYFTVEYGEALREGRIMQTIPFDKHNPIHTVWDLGGTDATAGWLFQIDGVYVNLIFTIHDNGKGLKYYLDLAERVKNSMGGKWGNHWMPHDVKQKHQGWQHAESRINIARENGWNFQVVPKVNFEDGIEALRFLLHKVRIDKNNCNIGLTAIREYQRSYDQEKKMYASKPMDNWATHIVDALRYLAVVYKRLYSTPNQKTVKYSVS
jgi:hypothetical protein